MFSSPLLAAIVGYFGAQLPISTQLTLPSIHRLSCLSSNSQIANNSIINSNYEERSVPSKSLKLVTIKW